MDSSPPPFLAVAAFAVFWLLTAPQQLSGQRFDALQAAVSDGPDLANGELVFWAGGCGSCHAEKGAKGEDKKLLGGGHRLDTPAGIFVTPNISPDAETGIGNWSLNEFANAMLNGVSPDGSHYYPSFPYTSYTQDDRERCCRSLCLSENTACRGSGQTSPMNSIRSLPCGGALGFGNWCFCQANRWLPLAAGR